MITAVSAAPLDLATPVRDFATKDGSYLMKEAPVGQYLELLGLYDPSTRTATWDASIIHADFQRAILPIKKNPIKRRMFRDLLRGGTLPPVVLYDQDQDNRPLVVDGLQRTHVSTKALTALLALERGDALEEFAQEELEAMKELDQAPLSVDDFLQRPIVFQLWRDLDADELVRLFMVLNVGQQKVSPRHLLEVMGRHLKEMFQEWDLTLMTERQEKEQPRRRGRRTRTSTEETHLPPYRYEYLLDGLYAYVARDPQVKTSALLQRDGETPKLALEERVTEIGSELSRADFRWVCRDLNDAITEKYSTDPKWRVAIQSSDNFFIPLMAALGDARHNERARAFVEDRKTKLIELIKTSDESDPLAFARDDSDSLANIQGSIRSNIGRRQRAVVYSAWRRYFLLGLQDPNYPIEWRTALLSD
jgi:hypothetical protein